MTAIGVVTFIIVALAGWAIAEGKYKALTYVNNADEEAVLSKNRELLEQNGYSELSIKDVIRTIATTGYSAV